MKSSGNSSPKRGTCSPTRRCESERGNVTPQRTQERDDRRQKTGRALRQVDRRSGFGVPRLGTVLTAHEDAGCETKVGPN